MVYTNQYYLLWYMEEWFILEYNY